MFSFVGGFQSFFGIGKGQGVTIEVGPVAMDKVHQSFLEIDQKDSKKNEIDQGKKDSLYKSVVWLVKRSCHVEDKEKIVKDTS